MTNERIAGTAAAGELGLIAFWLVPHAAALGALLTVLLTITSGGAVIAIALVIAARFGVDDPWHAVGLDPMWDLSLAELTA